MIENLFTLVNMNLAIFSWTIDEFLPIFMLCLQFEFLQQFYLHIVRYRFSSSVNRKLSVFVAGDNLRFALEQLLLIHYFLQL